MIRNSKNMLDCFNKRCIFHLKLGFTLVGNVIDDSNDMITIEVGRENKREIKFSQSLIHDYEVSKNNVWDIKKVRAEYIHQHSPTFVSGRTTKKMIIFGAGASYDFKDNHNENSVISPITNKLFEDDHVLKYYPGALNLRPKILTFIEAGGTLEEYFEEKWQEILEKGDNKLLSHLINTQFYLQHLFKDISFYLYNEYPNNYCILLEHIRRYLKAENNENIAVVSFNYDTLFENALFHIYDLKHSSTNDYIFEEKNGENHLRDIMLFKPHGSWNWIHPLEQSLMKDSSLNGITDIANAFFKGGINYAQLKLAIAPYLSKTDMSLEEIPTILLNKFKVVDYHHDFNYEFYPNLLIPFKAKDETLMPLLHTSMMKNAFNTIEEILIIGWKGTEENFNNILKHSFANRKIKITYVSPNSTSAEDELKKYLLEATFQHFKGGFSDYLKKIKTTPQTSFNIFQ